MNDPANNLTKKSHPVLWTAIAVLIVLAAYANFMIRRGFSAKAEPSGIEKVIARTMRNLAIPSSARNEKNPLRRLRPKTFTTAWSISPITAPFATPTTAPANRHWPGPLSQAARHALRRNSKPHRRRNLLHHCQRRPPLRHARLPTTPSRTTGSSSSSSATCPI